MNFSNKIALVTGGSRGLGRTIALNLARRGADVVLTYRERKSDGEAVAAEIEALGRKVRLLQLDVAETKSFPAFADAMKAGLAAEWQRESFDFLINNAGIDSRAPFAEMTEENFDRLFNVHFKGVYFLTQKLLPLLADGGRIVNTSTGLARFAIPSYSAYASMKGECRGEGFPRLSDRPRPGRSAGRHRRSRRVPLLRRRPLGKRPTHRSFGRDLPLKRLADRIHHIITG